MQRIFCYTKNFILENTFLRWNGLREEKAIHSFTLKRCCHEVAFQVLYSYEMQICQMRETNRTHITYSE